MHYVYIQNYSSKDISSSPATVLELLNSFTRYYFTCFHFRIFYLSLSDHFTIRISIYLLIFPGHDLFGLTHYSILASPLSFMPLLRFLSPFSSFPYSYCFFFGLILSQVFLLSGDISLSHPLYSFSLSLSASLPLSFCILYFFSL